MVNFQDIPVTELIPQRQPLMLVDKVLHNSEEDTETVLEIREDNIFLDEGHLSMAGLLENMAQSCACRMGCRCIVAGSPVRIGVVGAIRNCIMERLPRLGETLHTHVCIMEEVLNLTLASVVVKVGDETIATTLIKMAMTE